MSSNPPTDPSDPKPWWLSKTVYLNALLTVIGIGTFLAEPKNDPALTVPSIAAAVVGIGNVALRVWFTAAPIAGTHLAKRMQSARAVAIAGATAVGRASR